MGPFSLAPLHAPIGRRRRSQAVIAHWAFRGGRKISDVRSPIQKVSSLSDKQTVSSTCVHPGHALVPQHPRKLKPRKPGGCVCPATRPSPQSRSNGGRGGAQVATLAGTVVVACRSLAAPPRCRRDRVTRGFTRAERSRKNSQLNHSTAGQDCVLILIGGNSHISWGRHPPWGACMHG